MCAVYSLYGMFWLICSALYWRDLLRLQLWIGGVIFLGLIEKAAYLAEYEAINRTGETVKVAMLIAEVISCFKSFGTLGLRISKTTKILRYTKILLLLLRSNTL